MKVVVPIFIKNSNKTYILLLLVCIPLLFHSSIVKSVELPFIPLSTLHESPQVSRFSGYYVSEKSLEWQDVWQFTDEQFVTYENGKDGFGYTSDDVWIKFKLFNDLNHTAEESLLVRYAFLDQLDIYIQLGDEWRQYHSGQKLPHSQRPDQRRFYKLDFDLEIQQHATILIRANSIDPLRVPVSIWNQQSLHQKEANERLMLGMFYGFFLLLISYSLSLYFALKEKILLYFIGSFLGYCLLQLQFDGLQGKLDF